MVRVAISLLLLKLTAMLTNQNSTSGEVHMLKPQLLSPLQPMVYTML